MNREKIFLEKQMFFDETHVSQQGKTNPWEIGDVYAYQFHSKKSKKIGIYNKYIIFQKIDNDEWYDGFVFSRVLIYDKIYEQIPLQGDIDFEHLLPIDNPIPYIQKQAIRTINMNAVLSLTKGNEYQKKYFTYICNFTNFKTTQKHQKMFADHPWKNLEDWLCEYVAMWQNYEYDMTTNSIRHKTGDGSASCSQKS